MLRPADLELQRIYDRVDLVRGAGNPREGKLCIMSFVACLAGESHTDYPASASACIRRFAIVINDEMSAESRQTLKPFAPRILGTNDGHEQQRLQLLREAFLEEIAPMVAADFGQPASADKRGWKSAFVRLIAGRKRPEPEIAYCAKAVAAPPTAAEAQVLPRALARLIARCAKTADIEARRELYWSKAVDILDRLCGVGSDRARPPAHLDRVVWLGEMAARREARKQRRAAALARISRLLEERSASPTEPA